MKRNVVMIHLESLNLLNYRLNPSFFENIRDIEKKGVAFENYYASATSTLMVMSDIAHGGLCNNEKLRTIYWDISEEENKKTFLDEMKANGYNISAIAFPYTGKDIDSMNNNNFLGREVKLDVYDEMEEYHRAISKALDVEEPFLLWACNFISNVDNNHRISNSVSGTLRWEEGHRKLDAEVGYVFDLLKKKHLMENTVVVLYGDHGDDMYSHGYHGGLIHAIEPYEQIIHTPLIIYDKYRKPGVEHKTICSFDLSEIIKDAINGKDILTSNIIDQNDNIVFSRNMFAGQKVRSGTFSKGYSVSDGMYMLMVRPEGLSLYETRMDPTCQHNILGLFSIEKDGLVIDYGKICELGFHFKHIFDDETLNNISKRFLILKNKLREYVYNTYKMGECSQRLFEMEFDRIDNGVKNVEFCNNGYFDVYIPYFAKRKIVVFGAGEYGKYCVDNVIDKCTLCAWVDSNYKEIKQINGTTVETPDTLCDKDFDFVYIAANETNVYQEIFDTLVNYGVNVDKII